MSTIELENILKAELDSFRVAQKKLGTDPAKETINISLPLFESLLEFTVTAVELFNTENHSQENLYDRNKRRDALREKLVACQQNLQEALSQDW